MGVSFPPGLGPHQMGVRVVDVVSYVPMAPAPHLVRSVPPVP